MSKESGENPVNKKDQLLDKLVELGSMKSETTRQISELEAEIQRKKEAGESFEEEGRELGEFRKTFGALEAEEAKIKEELRNLI